MSKYMAVVVVVVVAIMLLVVAVVKEYGISSSDVSGGRIRNSRNVWHVWHILAVPAPRETDTVPRVRPAER